jgi:ribosome-binding protein aMBF1 (putative translation factor)
MEGAARAAKGIKQLGRRVAMELADEPVPLFHAIAAQVAERRRGLDLSQRELADLCGTTQSAVARLERGQRPPRVDTLMRIANALDCELVVELRSRTRKGGD